MNDYSDCGLDNPEIKTLARKFRLSPLIIQILIKRGYDSQQKIDTFLNVNENQLNDPFLLKNMDVLCNRIKLAVNTHESIVVFGDYDVDGISASFILWDYLKSLNANVNYFLPCRIADGYGLSKSTIDQVNQQYNPSLIVTVDCGISCWREIEYAKSLGIEVLVTDHHEIPNKTPEIFVNAKYEAQDYPFRELCGAGLAFKVVQALSDIDTARKYLPVAAIATIADIVSLTGENRAIVKLGLSDEQKLPKGLRKLIQQCGVSKISAKEISFKVAPKINAPGRLGDCDIAIKLYIEQDENKINKLIDEILSINERRQQLCNEMFEECQALLKNYDIKNKRMIILKSPNQDKGLLGIIAARIAGEYGRPTIIFNEDEGLLKGSCRSIPGVNCVHLFEAVQDLLDGFGGHSMAGGLSMHESNFNDFCSQCERYLLEQFEQQGGATGDTDDSLAYDLELNVNKLNMQFARQIELLEPTGCDNRVPIFKINFSNSMVSQNRNYPNHFYIKIGGEDFTAFNFSNSVDILKTAGKKTALCEMAIESYRNQISVKRYLRQVDLLDGPTEEDFKFYHLSSLCPPISDLDYGTKISKAEIIAMKCEKQGVLFVVGGKSELSFMREYFQDFGCQNFKINHLSMNSTILCAPYGIEHFDCYKKIVFLHKPPQSFLQAITQNTTAEIYYCDEVSVQKRISFDIRRETFAECFNTIKKTLANKNPFINFKDFVFNLTSNELKIHQVMFCYAVFEELNIIKQETESPLRISIDFKKKNDLDNSLLFKELKGIIYGI